jgi:hypothetical protein
MPHRYRCMEIPLPDILTYTECMLVYALYHTSHIFYVSDTSITWQITWMTIHLEHIYIWDTIWNNNIIAQTFILSYNIQHSSIHISHQQHIKSWNLTRKHRYGSPTCSRNSIRALCCYCCTTPVVPPEITNISHKISSFKDTFHNNHINS